MENRITTIISYCSNDRRFIDKCIEESRYFSDQIIIPVCDHFYDGSKENDTILRETFLAHPDVTFVQFPYDPNVLYSPYLPYRKEDKEWSSIWHATARYVGFIYASLSEYYLFLDCDEIPDGKRFAKWLNRKEYQAFDALRFLCYRYFYKPQYRSTLFHHNALLIRGDQLLMSNIIQPYERYGTFFKTKGKKKERISENNDPFFHHFNWVKTEEEMIKKAETWGHRWEKNWKELIENLYAGSEVIDFAFEERLEKVTPFFDPFCESPTKIYEQNDFPHLIRTSRREVLEKMIDRETSASM